MSSLKGQSRHGELRVAMAEISKMEEDRALEFLALEPEQEATYDS